MYLITSCMQASRQHFQQPCILNTIVCPIVLYSYYSHLPTVFYRFHHTPMLLIFIPAIIKFVLATTTFLNSYKDCWQLMCKKVQLQKPQRERPCVGIQNIPMLHKSSAHAVVFLQLPTLFFSSPQCSLCRYCLTDQPLTRDPGQSTALRTTQKVHSKQAYSFLLSCSRCWAQAAFINFLDKYRGDMHL